MEAIEKGAFKGCKKLRYLVVQSEKIKTVGKDAFVNTSSKMKVKTPKKRWEKYAKLFRQNGISKQAVYLVDPVAILYEGVKY